MEIRQIESVTERLQEAERTVSAPKPAIVGVRIEERTILHTVAMAAGTDNTRRYLQVMHVESTIDGPVVAVCTDGRRLHICRYAEYLTAHGYETGDYLVKKCNKTRAEIDLCDISGENTFPNWRAITERDWSGQETIDFTAPYYSAHYAKLIKLLPDNRAIDLSYLEPLRGKVWDVSLGKDMARFTDAEKQTRLEIIVAFMKINSEKE